MATPQTDLIIRPVADDALATVQRLGKLLSASGYFADVRDMAQAAVKVLAGQELGIPPIASMMGINLIKGKIVLSGNLIASRIRAHGYEYRHRSFDNHGCVLEFYSKPNSDGKRESLGLSSFTEEDAKTAKLLTGDNYSKYPRNMYFNRAISNGAKWYTPDVFAGAPVYTAEEMGAVVDEHGDVAQEQPAQPAQQPAPIDGKPWQTFKGMLQCFAEVKARLPEEAYYACLQRAGVTHSNEFRQGTADKALACWRELIATAELREDLDAAGDAKEPE